MTPTGIKPATDDFGGHSYFHRGGDTALLGSTIPVHFLEIVERFPCHQAVVSLPQQRRLSYLEFPTAIHRLASGLISLGFNRGSRIGVWSTNNVEWLLIQMATARIGAIPVNINPAYRRSELAYALQQSQVQGLFVIPSFRHSDYIGMLIDLIPELKSRAPQALFRNLCTTVSGHPV